MTVTSIRAFEVKPGRQEELISVLGDAKRLFEANGSTTRAATTFYGGETTGRITMLNAFNDLTAMSTFLQTIQALEAPNPIAAALAGDDAPATMISASVLNDITPKPQSTLVTERPIANVLAIQTAPGQRDAVVEAMGALQEVAESRGGEVRLGQLQWAGPLTGALILAVSYESGEALAEAQAAREASSDRPLGPLMASGAAQIVNNVLMTRIDLG
jgi:hypothetical protein